MKTGLAYQQTLGEWNQKRKDSDSQKCVDGMTLPGSPAWSLVGGAMNREAAALGVPVFSIFRGEIGLLDRELQKEGKLVLRWRCIDRLSRQAFSASGKSTFKLWGPQYSY
jgi:hypothetical protein